MILRHIFQRGLALKCPMSLVSVIPHITDCNTTSPAIPLVCRPTKNEARQVASHKSVLVYVFGRLSTTWLAACPGLASWRLYVAVRDVPTSRGA